MRWNAIIDTSGTPPVLEDRARKPEEIEAEIIRVATENNCHVKVWFDRFSWSAYIVLKDMGQDQNQFNADARRVLEILEARTVRQWLDVGEKSEHPNVR
jgi:hypothetical protein